MIVDNHRKSTDLHGNIGTRRKCFHSFTPHLDMIYLFWLNTNSSVIDNKTQIGKLSYHPLSEGLKLRVIHMALKMKAIPLEDEKIS